MLNKRFRRGRLAAAGLAAAGLCAALLAWHVWAPNKQPDHLTAKAEYADLEDAVLATGMLEAVKQVDVGAQVSGQLKTLKVGLGDQVEQGQWLAEIDPVISRNALRQAQAGAENLVAQKRAALARLAQSKRAFQREQQMLPDDATSRQDYEAAQAALEVQHADLASLDAQIRGARIEIETARANLGYTRIVAPMSGEVVALVTQEGQTLIAQQEAPVLLKLADLDVMTVKAQVSEADVIRIAPGQPAYFTILGEPDKRYHATLKAIEPAPQNFLEMQTAAGGTGSLSRSNTAVFYNAVFDVPNPGHRLRIAMTAQVSILLGTARHALTIPVTALGEKTPDGGYLVRVLGTGGTMETRRVRTGLDNHVKVEVRSGLAAGERVVISDADDPSDAET
jgi:membrane fusion protein, macrolide-specific efflux system